MDEALRVCIFFLAAGVLLKVKSLKTEGYATVEFQNPFKLNMPVSDQGRNSYIYFSEGRESFFQIFFPA